MLMRPLYAMMGVREDVVGSVRSYVWLMVAQLCDCKPCGSKRVNINIDGWRRRAEGLAGSTAAKRLDGGKYAFAQTTQLFEPRKLHQRARH